MVIGAVVLVAGRMGLLRRAWSSVSRTLLINSALSMGANRWFLFTKIVLPAASPSIFTGIRAGLPGAADSRVSGG